MVHSEEAGWKSAKRRTEHFSSELAPSSAEGIKVLLIKHFCVGFNCEHFCQQLCSGWTFRFQWGQTGTWRELLRPSDFAISARSYFLPAGLYCFKIRCYCRISLHLANSSANISSSATASMANMRCSYLSGSLHETVMGAFLVRDDSVRSFWICS